MIIFVNDKSTKFCQITLHIKRFIHKRKVVPFFCRTVYIHFSALKATLYWSTICLFHPTQSK